MAITGGFGFMYDTEAGVSRKWVMDKEGVKRWADNGELINKFDAPEELRKMSEHMADVAVKMDYYGGFNGEMKEKATELLNASRMTAEWADYIELESGQ